MGTCRAAARRLPTFLFPRIATQALPGCALLCQGLGLPLSSMSSLWLSHHLLVLPDRKTKVSLIASLAPLQMQWATTPSSLPQAHSPVCCPPRFHFSRSELKGWPLQPLAVPSQKRAMVPVSLGPALLKSSFCTCPLSGTIALCVRSSALSPSSCPSSLHGQDWL